MAEAPPLSRPLRVPHGRGASAIRVIINLLLYGTPTVYLIERGLYKVFYR